MNILFNLHSYIPEQMSGAETMAHRMAKYLVSKGHNVTVLTKWPDKVIDGVKVKKRIYNEDWTKESVEEFSNADLIFTHLGQTDDTFNKARLYKKKIIHIVHNSFNYNIVRCRIPNNYLVYNSKWVQDVLKYNHPVKNTFTLYPPVDFRDYSKVDIKKAKYITLINHNENKGGGFLIELAKKLPNHQFLAVQGGYEDQIKDDSIPNIKYVPPVKDIKQILKDIRVLIVPSNYESWGQVAIEAASCGIPVIANPTPGLKEAMSGSAIYADRESLNDWVNAIQSLDDKDIYAEWSKKAKNRAIELDPLLQLSDFEAWLHQVNKERYIE